MAARLMQNYLGRRTLACKGLVCSETRVLAAGQQPLLVNGESAKCNQSAYSKNNILRDQALSGGEVRILRSRVLSLESHCHWHGNRHTANRIRSFSPEWYSDAFLIGRSDPAAVAVRLCRI